MCKLPSHATLRIAGKPYKSDPQSPQVCCAFILRLIVQSVRITLSSPQAVCKAGTGLAKQKPHHYSQL